MFAEYARRQDVGIGRTPYGWEILAQRGELGVIGYPKGLFTRILSGSLVLYYSRVMAVSILPANLLGDGG